MRAITLLFITLLSASTLCGKDLRTVSATYTYYASTDESVDEARRNAFERAISRALAAEFGMTLSQTAASYMAETDSAAASSFVAASASEIRGEWIETIGEPSFEMSFAGDMLVVTVSVKGRAREIPEHHTHFSATTMRNGLSLADGATGFNHGDTMYLHFQSPQAGYVAVYLLDLGADAAFRLLPYSHDPNKPVAVDGGATYSFFSANDTSTATVADELEFTCENAVELNDLCVLFSPQPFILPQMAATPGEIGSMPLGAFRRWLAGARTRDSRIDLKTIHLTIKNQQL